MAEQTASSNPWYDYIMQGTKPVSGNQFQTGTQSLNSMGSVNSENPASTGFAAASQGPTGGGFNAQASVPTSATQTTQNTNQSNLQNPIVGNTAPEIANQNTDVNQQLLSANQAAGVHNQASQQQGQQSSTGLPESIFHQATTALGITSPGQSLTDAIGLTGPSGIGAQLNAWGAGQGFGAGSSANSVMTTDQFANAGNLTSASITDILSGGGFGAGLGSLLAGFTGENQTNSSIGGGIGGALGAATGITSGLELGATLGSIVPGIGTVIGAVGGSLLGGMFGPGTPTNAEGGGGSLNADGTVNYKLGGQKNPGQIAGFTDQASTAFSGLASAASQALGFQFNPNVTFGAAISTKHPGPGGPAALEVDTTNKGGTYDSGKMFFNPSDSSSVATAYYNALNDAAQQSGYTNTEALYNWFYGANQGQTGIASMPAGVSIAPKGTATPQGTIVA